MSREISAEVWRARFPNTHHSVRDHRDGRSEIGIGLFGDYAQSVLIRLLSHGGDVIEEGIYDGHGLNKAEALIRAQKWAESKLGPLIDQ